MRHYEQHSLLAGVAITDADLKLGTAIESQLPNTQHFLCAFHVMRAWFKHLGKKGIDCDQAGRNLCYKQLVDIMWHRPRAGSTTEERSKEIHDMYDRWYEQWGDKNPSAKMWCFVRYVHTYWHANMEKWCMGFKPDTQGHTTNNALEVSWRYIKAHLDASVSTRLTGRRVDDLIHALFKIDAEARAKERAWQRGAKSVPKEKKLQGARNALEKQPLAYQVRVLGGGNYEVASLSCPGTWRCVTVDSMRHHAYCDCPHTDSDVCMHVFKVAISHCTPLQCMVITGVLAPPPEDDGGEAPLVIESEPVLITTTAATEDPIVQCGPQTPMPRAEDTSENGDAKFAALTEELDRVTQQLIVEKKGDIVQQMVDLGKKHLLAPKFPTDVHQQKERKNNWGGTGRTPNKGPQASKASADSTQQPMAKRKRCLLACLLLPRLLATDAAHHTTHGSVVPCTCFVPPCLQKS